MSRLQNIIMGSLLLPLLLVLSSCKNEEISDDSIYTFREIHEDVQWHFDQIELGNSNYYILERDRNNPHEGFGFMAFNGDRLTGKQDTLIALMKANLYANARILSKLNRTDPDEELEALMNIFDEYLPDDEVSF